MGQSASTNSSAVKGVNDIPPPQFDANANTPPQHQHNRVIDFVRVGQIFNCRLFTSVVLADLVGSTNSDVSRSNLGYFPSRCPACRWGYTDLSRYTFDSRANRDDPDTELCRVNPDGGKSCIKVSLILAIMSSPLSCDGET
jgi:hypothetical protein